MEKREHEAYKEKLHTYDEGDCMNPRNFLSQIYENDEFISIKTQAEKEIIEQARLEVERKAFLNEADEAIRDLELWKA